MLAHLRPVLRVKKSDFLSAATSLALDSVSCSRVFLPNCLYTSLSNRRGEVSGQNVYLATNSFKRLRSPHPSISIAKRTFVQVSPTELYDVMGLTQKATTEEIKSTYFKLSKVYHPDVCKDPAGVEKFVLISKAYEVLGNEEKRREYDRGIFDPNESRGQGAARATREFSQEEVLRYQEIFNQHHDLPKAKRQQFVQKGKRQGVYDFDEYYKQHYQGEMKVKAQAQAQANEFNAKNVNSNSKNAKDSSKPPEKEPELSLGKKVFSYVFFIVVLFGCWYCGLFTHWF